MLFSDETEKDRRKNKKIVNVLLIMITVLMSMVG